MEAGVDWIEEGKDEALGRVNGGADGKKAGPVVGRWHCGTIRVGRGIVSCLVNTLHFVMVVG
jgi:hypothetical protein